MGHINLKGELFSSTFTYGVTAVVKIGSSLILTRLLNPEAYGVFSILLSFMFIIEMLSDVGFIALLVRHPRGNEVKFVHTVWTTRLIRCCVNFGLVFLGAPILAKIYQTPELTAAFRVLSFQFLISGVESMSFILAQRDQRARIGNYADMLSGIASSLFVIAMAFVLRNYFAFILGVLFQRALLTVSSHFFYRKIGIGFEFDREAMKDQFKFGRFVLPSSMLSMILSQYDKVILLKLFNLSLLGVYGIAGNMIGPLAGVINHNARVVLYARCAGYFRFDAASARSRYYAENRRLLLLGVALPAAVAGLSQAVVAILYDNRYAMVGPILMILALGALIASFQSASENLLVASGQTQIVLTCNVFRLLTVIPATLLGYHFFGFYGFIWFNVGAAAMLLGYQFFVQRRSNLLNLAAEVRLALIAFLVFVACLGVSHLLLLWRPPGWLHFVLGKH